MKTSLLYLPTNVLRLSVITLFFTLSLPVIAKTLYVDSSRPDDSGNGESWATAKATIQAAINSAVANDEIWVKAGTYTPTSGSDRTISISLKNDVAIYGGFAGTETSRNDRNISANPTILSGDIGTVDTKTDNSYHVIDNTATVGDPLTATAILDGFTIQAGYADDSFPDNVGAAMHNHYASPTIANCTFSNNEAILNGGAIYNSQSSPEISNCTFSSNKTYGSTVEIAGGAIYNTSSSPTISDTTFSNNSSESTREAGGKGQGGAIYNTASAATISECTFSENSVTGTNTESAGAAIFNDLTTGSITISISDSTFLSNTANQGGAVYNSGSNNATYSTLVINRCAFSQNSAILGGAIFNFQFFTGIYTNCTFYNNEATNSAETLGSGGVAYNDNTLTDNPVFMNCTLANNQAAINGGAFSNINSNPIVTNTICWDNSSTGENEIYDDDDSDPTVSYCVIEEGYSSGTNIFTDSPILGSFTNNGGKTSTMSISTGSSAIGAGTETDAPTTDQRGVPRPQDSSTDIGAFEHVAPASSLTFSDITSDSLTLSWTNGGGSNHTVFVKQTDSTTESASPTQETSYIANTTFGSGSQIGSSGWYCVYNSNGNSVSITGLSRDTSYRFMVCEYLTVNSVPIYTTETLATNPASQTTLNQFSVTFAASTNGSITGTTPQTVDAGGSCTEVTAVPDTNYKFINWTLADGSEYSTSAAVTVTNVTSNMALIANFSIVQYTITATAGDNGSISPAGSISVNHNASQTFIISADTGYTIDNVVVDGDSIGAVASYTFSNVTENHTIQALFKPNYSTETITVVFESIPSSSGVTSPAENQEIQAGTTLEITATAGDGYEFSSWSIDGVGTFENSESATTNFVPYSNCTVTANFIRDDSGDLIITTSASPASGGSTTASATTVKFGQTVDLTATPADSYDFLYWTISGNGRIDSPTSNLTKVVAYGNLTLTAVFCDSTEVATLVLKTDAGGVVSPASSNVKVGSQQTIEAIPYDNYLFAGWEITSGDASFVSTNNKYNTKTQVTINSNTVITALFKSAPSQVLEEKLKLDIFKTSKRVNRDWIRLLRAYMPLSQSTFNTELEKTDAEVKVVIDGNVFDIDKTLLLARQKKFGYSYVSANGTVRLNINFKKNEWTFRAKKTSLTFLDHSDRINVVFIVGDEKFGGNYSTTLAANWRIKQNSSDGFDVLNAYSKMSDNKVNNDIIRIKQGSLKENTNLYSSKAMIFSVDNWQVVIPAFSFDPLKTIKGLYKFPDGEDRKIYPKIQMILHPWVNQWKFNQAKVQLGNSVNFLDGISFYLLNSYTEEYRHVPVENIIYSMRLRYSNKK